MSAHDADSEESSGSPPAGRLDDDELDAVDAGLLAPSLDGYLSNSLDQS
jgi:hypothetical protein